MAPRDKQYSSGMILRLSWPTVNELSGKPVPRVFLTDYDRMTMDVDGEGTPYVTNYPKEENDNGTT